ncbi:MAG: hypothetical protein CSB44_06120 [Gammaproteobacteria bacterium]|nr:MAG: hypothetical protein CSB44_06120 [Gammaproteobacteria bacterium]
MTESAALLVDDVFPKQPVRQWVLSVPFPLRFLFASRPCQESREGSLETRDRSQPNKILCELDELEVYAASPEVTSEDLPPLPEPT